MVEKKKKLTAAELKKFIGKFPNLKKPGEDETMKDNNITAREKFDASVNMEEQMTRVFRGAILKAISRIDKPCNTSRPWADFSISHLRRRLWDELKEYKESNDPEELLDIINLACFLHLAHTVEGLKGGFRVKTNKNKPSRKVGPEELIGYVLVDVEDVGSQEQQPHRFLFFEKEDEGCILNYEGEWRAASFPFKMFPSEIKRRNNDE